MGRAVRARRAAFASQRSGVRIPSAPPGTTLRRLPHSAPLARDLPEDHGEWRYWSRSVFADQVPDALTPLEGSLARVQRSRSGHRAQRQSNTARPPAAMATVWPAGQVTVPAARSRSRLVTPPGTAGRSGIGLIVWAWPAAVSAARVSPPPEAESASTSSPGASQAVAHQFGPSSVDQVARARSASRSLTMIALRPVWIHPRWRSTWRVLVTALREIPTQLARSVWEIGRVIRTPPSTGSP
jgi:hypothetical protein